MKGLFLSVIGLALLAVLPSAARAQGAPGDLTERILEITQQIATNPDRPELYLQRGELYRARLDWDAAQADYDRAGTLDPKLTVVDLARGRLFLEANWPHSAKAALDRFLSRHPDHAGALALRARALVKLGQPLPAAQDYTHALAKTSEPAPEIYLERAQALMAAGSAHYEEALRGLDEGMKKLGPLLPLQLYAIELEVKLKRFDAALKRLDQVAASSPHKETWLARRGEILRDAGRPQEARQAFEAALAAIGALPPPHRNAPAMLELEKRLHAALAGLAAPASAAKANKG